MPRIIRLCVAYAALAMLAAGCSQLPTTGPSAEEVEEATSQQPGANAIQIVELHDAVARRLLAQRDQRLFSETFGTAGAQDTTIGAGDSLEINIWEAPPATLFGTGIIDPRLPAAAQNTMLPAQMVDREGYVTVPFAGRIHVAGQTTQAVEAEVSRRLKGKANQPEVLVRRVLNASSTVTVVGEVATSLRMPLTAGGERLLDALAAAGGVRQPVDKMTLQVTRGSDFQAMPLLTVIRDPKQNIPLRAGDVVTALFQPLSFTALGATGKNEEVSFEASGITLSQALARAGGLLDNRASPEGVFIFRFEPEKALDWPRQPVLTTPDGLVPVVYRVNLRDPSSFFLIQQFAVNNKDVIYVSNASGAELQKFLNMVVAAVYPVLNLIQITR